ncbi:MAG TPA: PhoU domain-containing protein [Thermoplasmata archaeon]|nr:PhoU domain-containing protein [Thermoplasmata archaeon]
MSAEPMRDETAIDHDREIRLLKDHLAEMTFLANGMVADGTRALITADIELRRSVVARDAPLDRYDVNIEAEAIRLVAILQPEGRDLRTIEALLKVANCVDRVGRLGYDLARNISTAPLPTEETHEILRKMDERARAMVERAMHAFVSGDAAEAKSVFAMDDEVDTGYHHVQQKIIELLRAGGPASDRLAYELLGARHLERVADNACKIAEKAVYAITGERRSEYFPPRPPRLSGPEHAQS